MTPGQLESYLGLLYGLPAGHLFRNAIPVNDLQNVVIGGADVLQTNPGNIAAAVHSFLHPDVRDAQAVSNQFGVKPKTPKKKTTKEHKLPKSQISVLVLNAGRVAGEAENTTLPADAARLHDEEAARRRRAERAEGAQRHDRLLRPGAGERAAGGAAASAAVRPAHGRQVDDAGHRRLRGPGRQPADGRRGRDELLGRLTVPKPPKVQPKTPPQVSTGAAMTAPRLRQVYDQVHFPLMVPHQIARYSQLSSQSGVRGFKPLKNQHEVALTFQVGQTYEYWQIEESTWKSAPILQNPSFTFTAPRPAVPGLHDRRHRSSESRL